jgi:23S rRNA (pseudouridine1915-N3)-methyltransferase
MHKITIYTVGKTKETWLNSAVEEYTKRLKNTMQIHWVLCKNSEQLNSLLSKEKRYICLDPLGKLLSSEEFTKEIFKQLEIGGSRLNIVIGAAEGIDPLIKTSSALLLSLSPLTFTHQLCRLVLLEQLYRASEIDKGTPYHK